MRLIRGLHNLKRLPERSDNPLENGCVATIGNFDGIHRGHQVIIDQVRDRAHQLGVPSVVMVFEPLPREFFGGADGPARLMRFREKVEVLLAHDVDIVVCLQFNSRLRNLSAMEFIEQVLIEGLNVHHLVVGDDFRFGCDRKGDFRLLQQVGESRGFEVEHTETICVGGDRISSTRVRQALAENRLADARELLGRPYTISGRVVYGKALGRELGVPTANILLGGEKPPLRGVYVVAVEMPDGIVQRGMANIGMRPTVNGQHPSLEVHLLDFSADLYGTRLTVTFLYHLRDEVSFDSVAELENQIHKDINQGRDWLANNRTVPTNVER